MPSKEAWADTARLALSSIILALILASAIEGEWARATFGLMCWWIVAQHIQSGAPS